MRFVDCQGLAGAWSLGTVQAGFDMVHRVSVTGGFGDEVADANRHLLGEGWEQEAGDSLQWTPQCASLVAGTPPCSGFSLMNTSKGANAKGAASPINRCMFELVRYGSQCWGEDGLQGAPVVAFESVQGAFGQGRGMMQELRDRLEGATGRGYALTHVKMSGSSVGAAQYRHRYFAVFHRVPFGVDPPSVHDLPDGRVVTAGDAMRDLEGAAIRWEEQPYPAAAMDDTVDPSNYARERWREDGLFGDHMDFNNGRGRSRDLVREVCEAGWPPGTQMHVACVRLGIRPEGLEPYWLEDEGKYKFFSWAKRLDPDRPAYVLTGTPGDMVHYSEPRYLTVRETARLMGYPDAWRWPAKTTGQAAAWIGKCCPVSSGRWISTWIGRALAGAPGAGGREIGRDEYLHDSTNDYKGWPGGRPAREAAA